VEAGDMAAVGAVTMTSPSTTIIIIIAIPT
jgi:hypothetical protein